MKRYFLTGAVLILGLIFQLSAMAQGNIVSVSKSTGTANVTIPLFSVSSGKLNMPVALTYSATGIKPTDIEGNAGVGWQIIAGGAITRHLRGLPDDQQKDDLGNNLSGWLNNTNGTKINNFNIVNDNNPATCTDETTDINYITGNLTGDTEPDLFNVDAPGLSCQLVFDNSHVIRTIPYMDLKITYTTGTTPSQGAISSFTITNDQGITYTFSATEVAKQKATTYSFPAYSFSRTTLGFYQNGVSYVSVWDLTKISDVYHNSINLTYTTGSKRSSSGYNEYSIGGVDTKFYTLAQSNTPNLISTLTCSNLNGSANTYTFAYTTNPQTGTSFISTITGNGKVFNLNYNTSEYYNPDRGFYKRFFLRNLTDQDCNSPFNYMFYYNGETQSSVTNLNPLTYYNLSYETTLPDSSSTAVDYWGYYNGKTTNTSLAPTIDINPSTPDYERYRNRQPQASPASSYIYSINGGDRSATASAVIGTLSQIYYIDGGSTAISYEPNDYYDRTSGAVVQGSGIRVTQIVHNDQLNPANNMVTNYSYTDPATGLSSGKAISQPIFAFTYPYVCSCSLAAQWAASTITSFYDLSDENHTVIYGSVTESAPGSGKAIYQYATPATNWDNSVSSDLPAWSPTPIYVGRQRSDDGTCAPEGFLVNDKNTYPFPPNPNYDFERQLPTAVLNYNSSNQIVSETHYSYQQSAAPVIATGFKIDNNNLSFNYAKYTINTSMSSLLSQVVNKQYDLGSTTVYRTNTTNYAYNTTQNKLVKTTVTNSDGAVEISNIKYVKDYTISSTTDNAAAALVALQNNNINIPVEMYNQVVPKGSATAKTVSALVTKFGSFSYGASGNMTLPAQALKLVSVDGIANFQPTGVNSGNVFTTDPNYVVSENDLGYDNSGNLLSKDDGFKHVQTAITDDNNGLPVFALANTRFDEIAMNDFDSNQPGVGFASNPALTLSTTNRTGQFGATLPAGTVMSKSLNRNALAKFYVFSIWINSGSAGNINVSVNGNGTNSGTIAFTNSGGWQYYETKIPLTGISSPTLTISFAATQAITIDDVLCYPDVAEPVTYAYDPLTHFKTAETNANGISSYYNYDQFGRLKYTYDQDKNIVLRKTYYTIANLNKYHAPYISVPSTTVYATKNATYDGGSYNACVAAGVTYTWDFGDGTGSIAGGTTSTITHTYAAVGNYTITLTTNSPLYGSKTSTQGVTVVPFVAVNITYTNNTTGAGISKIIFRQNGAIAYSFTQVQLISGVQVARGLYNIEVDVVGQQYNVATGQGYGATTFKIDAQAATCSNRVAASVYNYPSTDLTGSSVITFSLTQLNCSGAGGGTGDPNN